MKKLAVKLIRLYQSSHGPDHVGHCRFSPTCSQYTLEAIEKYGLIRGGLKGLWRILRCNPLCKGGYDPLK
ncbi:MAG: membrane protein insertion efficiency factor YidD [Clostridiales bacterium]|nr:membrane protein insertion efficiency factor YidD [Clostridiales bacterium]